MPALYGGIIMGVISGIPFLSLINCLCCAGILFGGFMSVFFYKKDLKPEMSPLTGGDAVQLGALAGVFGAIIGSVLSAIVVKLVGNVAGEAIMKIMDAYRDQLPPGSLDQMERSLSEGGLSALAIFMALVLDTIFGLLGGLIGYAVYKPKPAPPGAPPTIHP
jgi:hypothetical protein